MKYIFEKFFIYEILDFLSFYIWILFQSEPNSFVVLTDPTISYLSLGESTGSILSLSCRSKRRRRRSDLYEADDFKMVENDENSFKMSDFFSPRPKKSSQILKPLQSPKPTSQDLFSVSLLLLLLLFVFNLTAFRLQKKK